jgi:hypothetical protein
MDGGLTRCSQYRVWVVVSADPTVWTPIDLVMGEALCNWLGWPLPADTGS